MFVETKRLWESRNAIKLQTCGTPLCNGQMCNYVNVLMRLGAGKSTSVHKPMDIARSGCAVNLYPCDTNESRWNRSMFKSLNPYTGPYFFSLSA